MRLIDADKIPWTDLNADMPNSKIKVLVTFADKVNRMPTIEERKKGKWTSGDKMPDYPRVPYKPYRTYCSACGEEAIPDNTEIEGYILTDFCHNCGADMRQ